MHYTGIMKQIQIRDIPDATYERIVQLATRERRSIAQQTLTILIKGLEAFLDEKGKRRHAVAQAFTPSVALSDPAELVRKDRER